MTVTTMKTDSQIKADVLEELQWDSTVDETEIGVQVKKGIVTLTGSVPVYAKEHAAVRAAHRVFGVLDVVDNLKVKIPVSRQKTDQEVAGAVRQALVWDVFVPNERINSTVSDGMVTLTGEVETWAQRHSAERAVRMLTGVKGVINRIDVKAPIVKAEEIKHRIEEALERRAEREAKGIGVAVRDGVVTLTGSVRNWAERNSVERAAQFTPGVKRVEDKTIVDPYV